MGRIALVLGGSRSGKSAFAERVAADMGSSVAYVATARAHGPDMVERIARHRGRRLASWRTIEAPADILSAMPADGEVDAVMLECLYTWTANRLLALGDPRADGWKLGAADLENQLLSEVESLLARARAADWGAVLVSSEVGLGLAPEMPRQRVFRDLVGRVNERAAALADEVYLVVAGLAVDLRRVAFSSDAIRKTS